MHHLGKDISMYEIAKNTATYMNVKKKRAIILCPNEAEGNRGEIATQDLEST